MDRMRATCALITLACVLCTAGCYTVSLEPIRPQVVDTPVPLAARVDIPADTANYEYVVHSMMAGGANSWTIEVGKALVQYADAFCTPALTPGNEVTVQIELQHFDVHDFEAHCTVQFTVRRGSSTVFQKSYDGQGIGYAARVVWGGAFAMKSAMRRTTDEALRAVFTQFLTDVRARYSHWPS